MQCNSHYFLINSTNTVNISALISQSYDSFQAMPTHDSQSIQTNVKSNFDTNSAELKSVVPPSFTTQIQSPTVQIIEIQGCLHLYYYLIYFYINEI